MSASPSLDTDSMQDRGISILVLLVSTSREVSNNSLDTLAAGRPAGRDGTHCSFAVLRGQGCSIGLRICLSSDFMDAGYCVCMQRSTPAAGCRMFSLIYGVSIRDGIVANNHAHHRIAEYLELNDSI